MSPSGDVYEKVAGAWVLRSTLATGPQGPAGAPGAAGMSFITGAVAGNGAITAGTGFTITRTGVGAYTINFTSAFASLPVVLAMDTQSTRIVAALAVSTTSASILIVNTAGTPVDDTWNFIATRIV